MLVQRLFLSVSRGNKLEEAKNRDKIDLWFYVYHWLFVKGMTMGSDRKAWNNRQTELRRIMMGFDQHDLAIEIFLRQHAMVHSAKMSQSGLWSFEDDILDDISQEKFRRIPQNCEHSVAWLVFHIARIEDVAMNMLVAGAPQIFSQNNWIERMKIKIWHTGNSMDEESLADLSNTIDLESLRSYRLLVGQRTREIVQNLTPEDLKKKVEPARLQHVMEEGAVIEAARGIVNYWGRRNIAGLLLMPPTRHCYLHLNEALRLKKRTR